MSKIALIACCKKKQGADTPNKKIPAKEIYQGNSFKKARDIGVSQYGCEDYYIISAKHHLLNKDDEISYYDLTLNKMPVKDRKAWANCVLEQLQSKGFDLQNDEFFIFGGGKYYEFLKDRLNCTVFEYANSNTILLSKIKATYKNGGK